jgi:hypothetical protein
MSLVQTLMQPIRTRLRPNLGKNELRPSRYGVWDFYKSQSNTATGILTDDVRAAIKRSMGNTVVVPVLDAESVTIGNVRACTVPDSENTSKLVTLVFVTYAFGFTMTPAQHFNNDVSYQADFDRKFMKYLLKFANVLDTAAAANLNSNKNTYWPAEVTAYYPQVGNALQVTQAQKNDFYNSAQSVLNTMDYYEQTHVIASETGAPLWRRLDNQGANNGTNESFQLDPYIPHFSNRITNGAGVQSTGYLVPEGYVAVENRNDPDAIAGSRVGNNLKTWEQVDMPLVNMQMAAYYYEDCADRSALHAGTTNLTRTKVEGYEWSTDVCFINNYNSAPASRYNPIVKFEVSAT